MHYINAVDISRETIEKKVVFKTIVDYDAILSLNEKHIEQQLDHKDLRAIT